MHEQISFGRYLYSTQLLKYVINTKRKQLKNEQNSVVRYLYSTQLLKYVINSNGKLLRHKQISFGRFIFKSGFVIFYQLERKAICQTACTLVYKCDSYI